MMVNRYPAATPDGNEIDEMDVQFNHTPHIQCVKGEIEIQMRWRKAIGIRMKDFRKPLNQENKSPWINDVH
jgi:hypothetical protein